MRSACTDSTRRRCPPIHPDIPETPPVPDAPELLAEDDAPLPVAGPLPTSAPVPLPPDVDPPDVLPLPAAPFSVFSMLLSIVPLTWTCWFTYPCRSLVPPTST